jgi:hypothetical protein
MEQRLEDMVIALVNQNDVRIASPQGASRGDAGKSATDDHDTLSPHASCTWCRQAFAISRPSSFRGSRPNIFQCLTHLPAFVVADRLRWSHSQQRKVFADWEGIRGHRCPQLSSRRLLELGSRRDADRNLSLSQGCSTWTEEFRSIHQAAVFPSAKSPPKSFAISFVYQVIAGWRAG